MAKDMHSINLLPKKGNDLLDQFLNWSLTVGRLLIILTETLALSVFAYRFSLDMKITDLRDEIKQESLIVGQFRDSEAIYRDLQTRLFIAKTHAQEAEISHNLFQRIIDLGRGKVTFENIEFAKNSIRIEAQTPNTNSLNSFVNSLKNFPGIDSVNVDSIENKTASASIYIIISAKLKSTDSIN